MINDLKLQLSAKIAEMDTIVKTATEAKRSRTDEEVTKWEGLKTEADTLKREIAALEEQERLNKEIAGGNQPGNVQRINITTPTNQRDERQRTVTEKLEQFLDDGVNKREASEFIGYRATAIEGDMTSYAVGNQSTVHPDLQIIAPKSLWRDLGFQIFPNVRGEFTVPTQLMSEASGWVAEKAAALGIQQPLDGIKLNPKRDGIVLSWTKEELKSLTPGLLQSILKDANAAIERSATKQVFSKLAIAVALEGYGAKDEPKTMDYNLFNTLQALIEVDEGKFFTTRKLGYNAKGIKTDKSSSAQFLIRGTGHQMTTFDGAPFIASTLYKGEKDLVYGAPNQVFIADYGEMELIWDYITLADKGKVRLIINKLYDADINPLAFVKAANIIPQK